MSLLGFDVLPLDNPTQRVRLRRFFVGCAAHVMNLAFVVLCWAMGFLSDAIVALYAALAVAFNLIVFAVLRSGWNLRFRDPSLTFLQISVPAMLGLYVMYFSGLARGAFLLLGLAMFSFGMFRFRTRGFMMLAALILTVFALLIGLLAQYQRESTNLRLELLLWVAFAMTLGQFSFLAGMVGERRRKVSDKDQPSPDLAQLAPEGHRLTQPLRPFRG